MATTYTFRWGYKKSGVGTAPANAPTVKLVTSGDAVLGSGLSPTALANLPGVYVYSYVGADGLDPIGLISTTDTTMDAQDIWDYTPSILRDTYNRLGAPAGASIAADIGVVKAKTDNLPGDPADQSAVDAAITAAVGAIRGADNDTLKTLSDQVDNIGGGITVNATVAISRAEAERVSTGTFVVTSGYTVQKIVYSTSMLDLTAVDKLCFALKSKQSKTKSDSVSLLYIDKSTEVDSGLQFVNRQPYEDHEHGSLSVTGVPGNWEIAIFVDPLATLDLFGAAGNDYKSEVKAIIGTNSYPVWSGDGEIINGVILTVD